MAMPDDIVRIPAFPVVRLFRHILRVLAVVAVVVSGLAVVSVGRLEILDGAAWKVGAASILGFGFFTALVLVCLAELMGIQIELVEACRERVSDGARNDRGVPPPHSSHAGAPASGNGKREPAANRGAAG